MSQRNKQVPSTFDAFDRGRASSFGSLDSITEGDQHDDSGGHQSQSFAPRVPYPQESDNQNEQVVRRRRSSIAMKFNSLRQMGGPNSIDNFARSYKRAAAFREITPVRRHSVTGKTAEDEEEHISRSPPKTRPPLKSLLSQRLAEAEPQPQDLQGADDPSSQAATSETTSLLPGSSQQPSLSNRSRFPPEIGVSYGSISSKLSVSAQRRASNLIQQQVEASLKAREQGEEYKDDIIERPTVTETLPDGEVIERMLGESTVPMTIFNSINVLVGVGILALPLGVHYSGWILGIVMLTFAAAVTAYTAKLLAKCLDTNTASSTYGDIAYLAFDNLGRAAVEFLFVLELLAANIALVILFGDSMNSLLPQVRILYWKAFICIALIPLNFVPFRTLSVTSVLGIACVMGIIAVVFIDGILKPDAPGSLREPAKTYAFPTDYRTIPLSIGLFMAPWGGHSVFPAVYKDMRHPQKYNKALRITYVFTYGVDLVMAVLGYLMFGSKVKDEVTSNILTSKAYPRILNILTVVLIAAIPVTKIPLTNRPIMDTMNKKFLIDLRQMDPKARMHSENSLTHKSARAAIGIILSFIELGLSIGIPDFDSIMALMGSALCFTICVILPVSFYLKIFWGSNEIKLPERILCWVLIVISICLATTGTVFAMMPKHKVGAKSCAGTIGCL